MKRHAAARHDAVHSEASTKKGGGNGYERERVKGVGPGEVGVGRNANAERVNTVTSVGIVGTRATHTQVENTKDGDQSVMTAEKSRGRGEVASDVYRARTRDQLFWCLLMAVKSWEEADMPDKRERFIIETEEKTTMTELLQKTDDVPWKELKLSRVAVCSALGASINGRISVDVMRALAFLYGKNIAYVWGKGCCVKIPGARACGSSAEAQKWHVILRGKGGYTLAKDEKAVEMMNAIDQGVYYVMEDPNKPLMAASAYKICELQEIAAKLGVDTFRECGNKAKLKKDLYQDIVCAIHKID